ncbi:MAG: hypothetical protein SGJ09_11550 [Phycisphaerae bacterium]|nr:hypothetical protein [Phycisphaerae bacterium]
MHSFLMGLLLAAVMALTGCAATADFDSDAEAGLGTDGARLTQTLTRSAKRLCGLPSVSRLLEHATETEGGYWDFQTWIASSAAQAELSKLDVALQPFRTQSLGVAFDDVNQRAIVVVDPDRFDALELRLSRAIASAGVALQIHLQPGCNSRSALDEASSIINARSWHADAASATFATFLDPGSGRHVMTFDRWLSDAPTEVTSDAASPPAQASRRRRPAAPVNRVAHVSVPRAGAS